MLPVAGGVLHSAESEFMAGAVEVAAGGVVVGVLVGHDIGFGSFAQGGADLVRGGEPGFVFCLDHGAAFLSLVRRRGVQW